MMWCIESNTLICYPFVLYHTALMMGVLTQSGSQTFFPKLWLIWFTWVITFHPIAPSELLQVSISCAMPSVHIIPSGSIAVASF